MNLTEIGAEKVEARALLSPPGGQGQKCPFLFIIVPFLCFFSIQLEKVNLYVQCLSKLMLM